MPENPYDAVDRALLDSGWVDVSHVLQSLQITPPTFRKWRMSSMLPPYIEVSKKGRRIWFHRAYLDAYHDALDRIHYAKGRPLKELADARRTAAYLAAQVVTADQCPRPFPSGTPMYQSSHPGMFRPVAAPQPTNNSAQLAQELL